MILEGVRSGKTATEIQYDLIRMKRLGDRIKKVLTIYVYRLFARKLEKAIDKKQMNLIARLLDWLNTLTFLRLDQVD